MRVLGDVMRKIFLFVLILSLSFWILGCDLGESVSGPRNTWCRRTINVQGVDIDCYLLYSEDGYENSQLNSERFPGKRIEPGLTVVLNPLTDGFISGPASKFTSQCYTVKHFGLGEAKAEANQTVDGTDTAPKTFTVNNFMWNSLWLLNSATFSANGISTNPPSLLRQDGDLNFIDDLEIPELSWKQVLIAILEGL